MEVVTRDAGAQDVEPARRLAVKTAMFSDQDSHGVAEQLNAVIAGEALGTVLVATIKETVAGVAYVAAEPFSDRCFDLYFLAVGRRGIEPRTRGLKGRAFHVRSCPAKSLQCAHQRVHLAHVSGQCGCVRVVAWRLLANGEQNRRPGRSRKLRWMVRRG